MRCPVCNNESRLVGFNGLVAPILATSMLLLGQAATADEHDVVKAWDDWHRARADQDGVALDRVLAQEFLYIDQGGRRHPRAEYLAPATRDEPPIITIHREELQVRAYGDTAVVTGCVTVKRLEILGKEAADPPVRTTAVFMMRDGRWQATIAQDTRIGPSPAVASGFHPATVPGSPPRPVGIQEPGR
jgi:hypothetical protein